MKYSLSVNSKLRIKIALFGLGISLITLFSEEVVNRDGVLYLQTAQVFDEFGLVASFKKYSWPFYSIAIAVCHSITTLTFENSAHLLNVIFLLVLVDAFVQFYWEINSKTRYRWIPAVILLAYTGLNDYRPIIIRDWGYWAFLFQALFYFVRAYKNDVLKFHVLWQIFIVFAFLFRIEAVVFMMLLPFLFLLKKRSIVSFIKSTSLFCLSVVILFFVDSNWHDWGRISEVFSYMDVVSFGNRFTEYSYTVAKHAIPYYAERYAILFVLSGLFGMLLFKAIAKLGVFYIGLAIIGQFRYKISKDFQCSFVNLLLGISFFVVFVFFCNLKILAGRYLIQITLFLLLYVAYYAEFILDDIRSLGRPWLVSLIGCAFLINLVVGIHHSESNKLYIKEMGAWVRKNISDSSYVTTNDSRLYYYSGGILKNNMTDVFRLTKNEYALLKITHDDTQYDELIKEGKLVKIHSVIGRKGNSAILFKINHP